jgi:hypothetical protein
MSDIVGLLLEAAPVSFPGAALFLASLRFKGQRRGQDAGTGSRYARLSVAHWHCPRK